MKTAHQALSCGSLRTSYAAWINLNCSAASSAFSGFLSGRRVRGTVNHPRRDGSTHTPTHTHPLPPPSETPARRSKRPALPGRCLRPRCPLPAAAPTHPRRTPSGSARAAPAEHRPRGRSGFSPLQPGAGGERGRDTKGPSEAEAGRAPSSGLRPGRGRARGDRASRSYLGASAAPADGTPASARPRRRRVSPPAPRSNTSWRRLPRGEKCRPAGRRYEGSGRRRDRRRRGRRRYSHPETGPAPRPPPAGRSWAGASAGRARRLQAAAGRGQGQGRGGGWRSAASPPPAPRPGTGLRALPERSCRGRHGEAAAPDPTAGFWSYRRPMSNNPNASSWNFCESSAAARCSRGGSRLSGYRS